MTVAHDLFEHQQGVDQIGTIEDEFTALGAMWYIRGDWEQLDPESQNIHPESQNIHPASYHIASDVLNSWYLYASTGYDVAVPDLERNDGFDTGMFDTYSKAREWILDEHKDDCGFTFARFRAFMRSFLYNFQKGLTMAEERFGSQQNASILFWNVVDVIQDQCQHLEPGESFIVKWSEAESELDNVSVEILDTYYGESREDFE